MDHWKNRLSQFGYDMKKSQRGIQDFLFMILILFFVVVPAFHQCHELMDIEISSPPPHFEQAHPEQMASNRQGSWQGLELDAYALLLLLRVNSSEQASNDPPSIFPNDLGCPVLRC